MQVLLFFKDFTFLFMSVLQNPAFYFQCPTIRSQQRRASESLPQTLVLKERSTSVCTGACVFVCCHFLSSVYVVYLGNTDPISEFFLTLNLYSIYFSVLLLFIFRYLVNFPSCYRVTFIYFIMCKSLFRILAVLLLF